MVDYSGTTAGNVTLHHGDRITGNWTIVNGHTVTVDPGATVVVTGAYTIAVSGRIVCDVFPAYATIKSGAAEPSCVDWNGIQMDGVNAGQVIDGLILMHARFGVYHTASYAADHATYDHIVMDSCCAGFNHYLAAANTRVRNLEIRNSNDKSSPYTWWLRNESSTTWTIDRLWIHDCTDASEATRFIGTGTTNIGTAVLERISVAKDVFTRSGTGTPTLTIGALWCFALGNSVNNIYALFSGWTAGTLAVGGGIVYWGGRLVEDCLNANVTFDNLDLYLYGDAVVSDGNWTNCYFKLAGYIDGVKNYAPQVFQPGNVGSANGVAQYTAGPFFTIDSMVDARAIPNYPLAFASGLAASGVDTGGATLACAPGCPGTLHVFLDRVSRDVASAAHLSDYTQIGYASHFERMDLSGNNRLFDTLGSRSRSLDGVLRPGTTYYARAAVQTPWGEWYWGDEISFQTDPSADGGGDAGGDGEDGGGGEAGGSPVFPFDVRLASGTNFNVEKQ